MKITLEQLRTLIRETVEEGHYGYDDYDRYDAEREDAEEKENRRGHDEEDTDDKDPVSEFDFLRGPRGPVREGAVRLIYTNHGILTEERVRELKESGYDMEECGSWDVEGPSMGVSDRYMGDEMEEPVAKVLVVRGSGLEEGEHQDDKYGDRNKYSPGYGSMEEASLTEGDTSVSIEGTATGTQVGNVGTQGIPGSAASGNLGGANVPNPSEPKTKNEAFNHRAERLLEAWLEEELHGDQDKLDLDDDGEIEASDLEMLRHGLKDKQVGKDRKRS